MRGGEFLASLCLIRQDGRVKGEVETIERLSADCTERLRFFEIVYIVPERDRHEVEECGDQISRIANLRILFVRNDISIYRQRRIAASEAIGDVVVLTDFQEVALIDLPAYAENAFYAGEIQLARQVKGKRAAIAYPLLNLIADHRINALDMRTIAFPRSRLVQVLARETATIDLRFEPKKGDRYVRIPIDHRSMRTRRQSHQFDLLTELISNASTRYLRLYALVTLLAAVAAMSYVFYTVVVYISLDHVEPGWFTTNFTQGIFLTLLALGLSIFSLGIAKLTEQKDNGISVGIVDEVGNINFFRSTYSLNVDAETAESTASSRLPRSLNGD